MSASEREGGKVGTGRSGEKGGGARSVLYERRKNKRKNNSQTLVGVAHILAEDSHSMSQSPCSAMNINVFLLLK